MYSTGAAIVDITPPLGGYLAGHFVSRASVGIHDPLLAAAMVISNGREKVAMIGCDLIAMDPAVCARTRELVRANTGIPADNVMVWATHTHAGPIMMPGGKDRRDEGWICTLPERLAGAVAEAHSRLAEGDLRVAVGRETTIAFNRRYLMRDGTTRTNPGVGNPDVVRSDGPTDPDVGCLFAGPATAPSAILVNFACHLDVLGNGNHLISADYPYFMRETLAKAGFSGATVLFANGCCGNINHINVFAQTRQGGFEHCRKMGQILAGEVLKCMVAPDSITSGEPVVGARREILELEYRPFTEKEIAGLRRIVADPEIAETDFRKINARGRLGRVEQGVTSQSTELQAFRVGDLAIVGIPAEYFVEYGLQIKAQSPARWTFLVELANDCVGYVPTVEGFRQGAYEGQSARFVEDTGPRMAAVTNTLLQDLWAE